MLIKKEEKVPVVRLVSKYDDDYRPDNVHEPVVYTEATRIEDVLPFNKDDLQDPEPILIQAPTGFGKTWWILNVVLPVVIRQGGKLLIVSNRVAVSIQQKLAVVKIVEGKNSKWVKPPYSLILKDREDFGLVEGSNKDSVVKIMTYQRLKEFLDREEGQTYANQVTVVVADECHYFTSDSPFNRGTAKLLDIFPQLFKKAKRIYLSATPEDFIVPLAEKELQIPEGMTLERMESVIGGIPRRHYKTPKAREYPSIKWYRFVSAKYATLPVRYFNEYRDLLEQIKATGNEGWLIFVQSKEEGRKLVEEIGSDACFISADSKDSEEWQTLLSEERLPCRILVTTSVLDCGINISDGNLKHVVIPYVDRAMFMQSLGRKRFKDAPQFTLYVKAVDKQRLNGLMKQNRDLVILADKIEDMEEKGKDINRVIDEFLDANVSQAELALVYYKKSERKWRLNYPYAHKLHRQQLFYQSLKVDVDQHGESAFPRLVHQWLDQPDAYDEQNWLGYDIAKEGMQALLAFLGEYNGRLLSTESEQRTFSITLHRYYKSITGDRRNDNRGDGYKKTSALNTCLKKLGISGEVKSKGKNNGWSFNMVVGGGIKEPSEEND